MRSLLRITIFIYFSFLLVCYEASVVPSDTQFNEAELGQPPSNPLENEVDQRKLIHWVQQIIVSLDNQVDKWYKNQVIPEFASLGWMSGTEFSAYCAGSLVNVDNEKIIVTNAFCARMIHAHVKDIGEPYAYFSYSGISVPVLSIVKHPNFTSWAHHNKTRNDIAIMHLKQSDISDGLPDGLKLPEQDENTANTTGYAAQLIYSDDEKYLMDETEARSLPDDKCKIRIDRSDHSGWEDGAWLCVKPKEDNCPEEGYPYYVEKGPNDEKVLYGLYSEEGFTKHGHESSVSYYTNVAHYVDWIKSKATSV